MTLSDKLYYYMPDDLAKDQSNRGKYNCAESMYRAIVDHYNLKVSEDAKSQMAAFGGGMFVGDVCGFLVGGYAALAAMYADKNPPMASQQLKSISSEWYKLFDEEFSGTSCAKISPNEGGCSQYGIRAANVFEKLIKNQNQKD